MNYKVLISCLIIVFSAALLGSLFTGNRVDTDWYQSIKPEITPPNYVFPIVWNILFLMIALSLYLSWTTADQEQKNKIKFVFGLNLFLNVMWSVFYFGLMNPLAGMFGLVSLWLSIILMIVNVNRVNKKAAGLLVPYFLWVTFAGVLNYLSI